MPTIGSCLLSVGLGLGLGITAWELRNRFLRRRSHWNESQLLLLANSVPALVAYIDRQRRYRFVNAAFKQWFGYEREHYVGQRMADILGPVAYGQVNPELDRAMAGETVQFARNINYRTGPSRYVQATIIPDISPRGKVLGIMILVNNLTETKRQERLASLLDESTQLLTSSLDFQTTLDNFARLAVEKLGGWARVSLVNAEGALEAVAMAHEDPTKLELLRDLRRRFPFDRRYPNAELRAAFEGQSTFISPMSETEIRRVARDELQAQMAIQLGHTASICVPLTNRHGPIGVIKLASGARVFNQADFELAKGLARRASLAIENTMLYRDARAAISARDEFLSIASHELKTPLTSMRLQLDLMARMANAQGDAEAYAPTRTKDTLARMDRQIRRLTRLVDDMLDIGRISTGRLTITQEPVDLSALIEEAGDRMGGLLAQSGSALSVDARRGIWTRGDAFRLEQVLTNLLTNAARYGAGRPVRLRLEENGSEPDSVSLVVEDEGRGIAPQDQRRIFERFERAVPSSEISGIGVGLYIAREIVQALGGQISVESELGAGARFRVKLPKTPGPA